MVRKKWKYKNEKITPEAVRLAAEKHNIPLILANVLLNRDIAESEFESFLVKSKRSIRNPMSMLDMDKASERIVSAIEKKEKIAVYGDYDVDGITSTALLYEFSHGANQIFNSLTGGAVSVLIITLGIIMIVKGNIKLKNLQISL